MKCGTEKYPKYCPQKEEEEEEELYQSPGKDSLFSFYSCLLSKVNKLDLLLSSCVVEWPTQERNINKA